MDVHYATRSTATIDIYYFFIYVDTVPQKCTIFRMDRFGIGDFKLVLLRFSKSCKWLVSAGFMIKTICRFRFSFGSC